MPIKKLKIRFYRHLSFRLDILQSSSSGMKNLHANPLAHTHLPRFTTHSSVDKATVKGTQEYKTNTSTQDAKDERFYMSSSQRGLPSQTLSQHLEIGNRHTQTHTCIHTHTT